MSENRSESESTGGQRRIRPNDPLTAIRYKKCLSVYGAACLGFVSTVLFAISQGVGGPVFSAGLCTALGSLCVGMCACVLDGQVAGMEMMIEDRKVTDAARKETAAARAETAALAAEVTAFREDFVGAEHHVNSRLDQVMRMETAMAEARADDLTTRRTNGMSKA